MQSVSRTQCVARVQNRIHLNIRYMVGRTGHTHASRNAVTLVWGSLRLAPIMFLPKTWKQFLHICQEAAFAAFC